MADGKISVDLDKLYKEKTANENGNSGKARPKSLDELRAIDQEDRLMESMMNRGKISMAEYLMWQDTQERKKVNQQPAFDVESIIEKATAPLKEQLAEMKRQQEKAEQEKRYDALQTRIDKLTDLITSGASNKSDPIIDEIKALKQQLADEKEKASKAERERFEKSMSSQLDAISDEIFNLRNKGTEKTKSDLERLEELVTLQDRYRKALGVKEQNKDDDASTVDILSTGIDMINEKVPGIVKTVGTVREAFKGGSDLPDDLPPSMDIPTQLPSRNVPRDNKSAIPSDILRFLNEGEDKDGAFVDISGVQWQNEFTGKPLTRADIESKAVTDPESVRSLMKMAYEDVEKQKTSKPKTPVPDETPEIKKTPTPVADGPTQTDEPDDNALKDALDYVASGSEKEDKDGNKIWVGAKNEVYETDTGQMTREQMLAEARADPKAFLQTVKEHLESLE